LVALIWWVLIVDTKVVEEVNLPFPEHNFQEKLHSFHYILLPTIHYRFSSKL